MNKQEFFDRISFPTEYQSKEELKASIILLFITCTTFFILSSATIIMQLFIFSKTLLLGTITYEFTLFYLLHEYTKSFIEKKIKTKKTKKTLSITSTIIYSTLITLTFMTLIYTMLTPTPVNENKFISLTTALLIIIAPTFFWHELVTEFKKKTLKRFKLISIILIIMISINMTSADNITVNETSKGTLNTITESINTINKGINYITQLKTQITSIQSTLTETLNLTTQQTQIITIIGILITAFMLLKFLTIIVKWSIIILIAWIIIQMIFL